MRTIKFRAQSDELSGWSDKHISKTVYGYYVSKAGTYQTWHEMWSMDITGWWTHQHCWQVKPESVQQLIGIDSKGNEIYEGDEVKPAHVLDNSMNFIATMYDLERVENGQIVLADS